MVTVLDHPLASHLLAALRDKDTVHADFRRSAHQISCLLVLEATKGIRTATKDVSTPLEVTRCPVIDQEIVAVPILRAGLGMLEAVTDLFPDVNVGTIGLERSEQTAVASVYHLKLPPLDDRYVICLDPMLATGGSASQAIGFLKAKGATRLTMVSVVSTPEGIQKLQEDHPDVPIVTGSIDRGLNDKKFIVPGLGDFGDRLYGTL